MRRELSLEELVVRTRVPASRLREWRSLGLIGAGDAEHYRHEDVERVRLIQLFLRRGIDLQTIAEAARGPVFSRSLSGYLDKIRLRAGRGYVLAGRRRRQAGPGCDRRA